MSKKYIDIEPKWMALVPSFIALIEHGKPEGRKVAIEEIEKMARISDWVRQAQKRGVKMLRVPAEKKLRKVIA